MVTAMEKNKMGEEGQIMLTASTTGNGTHFSKDGLGGPHCGERLEGMWRRQTKGGTHSGIGGWGGGMGHEEHKAA